ncbi:MAG: hypothetical protein V3U18_08360 [Alphaproteobacteria bacterium]|jgi:hypothetical protein
MNEQVYRHCGEVFDGPVVMVGDTGMTVCGERLVVVRPVDGGEAFACGTSRLVPLEFAIAGWGHA